MAKRPIAKDVSEYISGLPKGTQKAAKQLRTVMKKLIPKAEERISYGIPVYCLNGKFVVFFAGYAKHVSLYPAPVKEEAFKKAFANYKTSKGTIRFPLDKPLPMPLINKIVKHLIKKNAERAKLKGK